jgi:beta-phosphoglucomutase-like phosphatase (HAD superfamily)
VTSDHPRLDLDRIRAVLCDADGTLFPSEEAAYAASADVTNRFLAELGADRPYSPEELQRMNNGKNFRATAQHMATEFGRELSPDELGRWVSEEKEVVTAHLRTELTFDPEVHAALVRLGEAFQLAAVTSSARSRLDACLEVTGLAPFFDRDLRFSAEDSLPEPTSKPDPAVYSFAGRTLGIAAEEGVALEDSVNGVRSATAAGFPTIGITVFVPQDEQPARVEALREAGAHAVVESWPAVAELLTGSRVA